ncbi:MAG: AcvB/VirJ family lysyl-phosphatidylglycerol hydrolase, partial [Thermoanaerobaculia bacterium]
VLLTGDSGWQPLEDALSTQLAADGIPVIALISPSYFATRRTIGETESAIERMIRLYGKVWHRPKILLIGYSRGAGVLPFVVSRLPADLRRRITEVALIGLGSDIDFRVRRRLPFWTADDELQIPVRPEIDKLRGTNIICVQGEDENESLCPALPATLARRLVEPGGHALDVDPRELARTLEAASQPSAAVP